MFLGVSGVVIMKIVIWPLLLKYAAAMYLSGSVSLQSGTVVNNGDGAPLFSLICLIFTLKTYLNVKVWLFLCWSFTPDTHTHLWPLPAQTVPSVIILLPLSVFLHGICFVIFPVAACFLLAVAQNHKNASWIDFFFSTVGLFSYQLARLVWRGLGLLSFEAYSNRGDAGWHCTKEVSPGTKMGRGKVCIIHKRSNHSQSVERRMSQREKLSFYPHPSPCVSAKSMRLSAWG